MEKYLKYTCPQPSQKHYQVIRRLQLILSVDGCHFILSNDWFENTSGVDIESIARVRIVLRQKAHAIERSFCSVSSTI